MQSCEGPKKAKNVEVSPYAYMIFSQRLDNPMTHSGLVTLVTQPVLISPETNTSVAICSHGSNGRTAEPAAGSRRG